jgi:hypothetical protein
MIPRPSSSPAWSPNKARVTLVSVSRLQFQSKVTGDPRWPSLLLLHSPIFLRRYNTNHTGNPKTLEYHHELPKHSIELINIKKIKPNEITSSTFELTFDEMYLM